MLVLTRRQGQQLLIGDDIVVTIVRVRRDGEIRIGVEAPRSLKILRAELPRDPKVENSTGSGPAEAGT